MVSPRGLRWSGIGISNGRQRLLSTRSNARSFTARTIASPGARTQLSGQRLGALKVTQLQQCRSISIPGWSSSKPSPDEFAVAHAPPTANPPSKDVLDTLSPTSPSMDAVRSIKASHATSDSPDPSIPSPPHTPEPQILHDLENTIAAPHGTQEAPSDAVDLSTIAEHIGYLKNDCGLDYGWGPTAFSQFMLEHLHITAGLSWALAIPALALISHAIQFKFFKDGNDTSARMREIQPIVKPLRDQMMEAQKSGDQARMQQLSMEVRAINKEYGVKLSRAFLPILIQIPLQFGAFRLLRGMTALPVPSLETTQWLWTTDLTLGDPYFILPIVNASVTYLTIRQGILAQTNPDATVGKMQNLMLVGFPLMSFVFLIFQPGAVQLYFLASGVLGLSRVFGINLPFVRSLLRMHPLPSKNLKNADQTGGMKQMQSSLVSSTEHVNPNSSHRSMIDKVVDSFKRQTKGWKDSVKSVSKTEDRQKQAMMEKAAEYEARAKMRIEDEKRYKNELQERNEAPGPLRKPTSGGKRPSGKGR